MFEENKLWKYMKQSLVEIKSELEKFVILSYFSTKAIKGAFKINVIML